MGNKTKKELRKEIKELRAGVEVYEVLYAYGQDEKNKEIKDLKAYNKRLLEEQADDLMELDLKDTEIFRLKAREGRLFADRINDPIQ